ncbi:MAG: hypothetical protein R3D67_14930 [Hyphomicrobiaceae bacterium]
MSTTAATFDHHIAAPDTAAPTRAPRRGFFQWLIEARQRQGLARVRSTFRNMSDMQLKDIGLTADHIRFVRAQGTLPTDFWA